MKDRHNYVKTYEEAAAVGINAGMDQEGGGNAAISQLHKAVNDSMTTVAAVEQSFRRVMRARIRLGMFDPPTTVAYNNIFFNATELAGNKAHRAVNTRAARESITLYKNDGGTLPLDAEKAVKTIAVVGFQGANSGILSGNYAASANAGNWGLTIAQAMDGKLNVPGGTQQVDGCSNVKCPDANKTGAFDAARKAAASSDAVVVLLGLAFDHYCDDPPGPEPSDNDYCEQEGRDRSAIELPAGQKALLLAVRGQLDRDAEANAVANLNVAKTPLVVVLLHGGAIALDAETMAAADAVVDAWYPAVEGAKAVADAVFGAYSPAGRTPVTWYKSTSDLPPLGHMSPYPNASDPATYPGITYRYFTKVSDESVCVTKQRHRLSLLCCSFAEPCIAFVLSGSYLRLPLSLPYPTL